MGELVHDVSNREAGRAPDGYRKPSHGKGMLKNFAPGNKLGGQRPGRYQETQQLARAHSLEAVQALVERLKDEDGRIVVVAANSILERAWGKPREVKPEEHQQANIDLSQLKADELAIMVRLVQSGRLRSQDDPPTIEGETPATSDT